MVFVRRFTKAILLMAIIFIITDVCFAMDRESKRKDQIEELQVKFDWWPTDALPAPVKDAERSGYWWWPDEPGKEGPLWGNRGYIYVYKIIYDYKSEELPPAKPEEKRPSLIVKKIIKNVKIYFDFDKSDLRDDAMPVLNEAVAALEKNPKADVLITGNCDVRGPETYNMKLGRSRAETVQKFMEQKGVAQSRIRIISRGKLDAVAHVKDLMGMQKDRNAQFMVAEVEEVMMPTPGGIPSQAEKVEEGKYIENIEEKVESPVKASTREYTIKKGDTLWKIADKEMGNSHRWKYLYEFNRDSISNPDKLRPGKKILIPIE